MLDGVSHGIYCVVHVLTAEELMKRTGRFSFLLGAAQTCHYVGDALSNLFGEYVADRYGYLVAFEALACLSIAPSFVYYFFMPQDLGSVHLPLSNCLTDTEITKKYLYAVHNPAYSNSVDCQGVDSGSNEHADIASSC